MSNSPAVPHPRLNLITPPVVGKKYRILTTFVEYQVLYQLGQGYLVQPTSNLTPNSRICELKCSQDCSFRIVADYATFKIKKVDTEGYQISNEPYEKNHNHDPPYFPLDLELELQRRDAGGSPSTPPLIPKGPMSVFLASINPALLKYYKTFDELGFFTAGTPVEDLVISLDEKEVADLLATKAGNSLPPFAKAEIAEGIKRCRERMQKDPTDLDGSILRGAERERALAFIQKAIEEGGKALAAAK